jgi:hypothetical protein
MKQLIIILFFISVGSVLTGFYVKSDNPSLGELLIGLGVAGAFFVIMPLFLYHRRNRRDVKDYMLTKDSFEKMREYEESRDRKKREKNKKED